MNNSFVRWLVRILQYLSFPFVGIEFIIRYLSALYKAKVYADDPERYSPSERYKTVYTLVSRIFYFRGVKIIKTGFENVPKKPVLFICNHKSNIDPLLLIQIMNYEKEYPLVSFVAKKELKEKGFGKIARLIDLVYIDRDDIRQMAESIGAQEKLLRSNISVAIFPEGTRIPGDEIGEFKAGALKVAYRAFAPIVPVTIYGSEGHMGSRSSRSEKFQKRHGYKIYVEFHKPLQPLNFMNVQSTIIANNARDTIAKSYLEIKDKVSKKNKKK